jgi:hypothetical protein
MTKAWRVIKQLLREFWLPLLVAVSWTWYRYHTSAQDDVISTLVTNFASSFFLASWATGQLVRVSRQQFTEDTLQTLTDNVKKVVEGVTSLIDAAEKLNVPGFQDLIASMRSQTTQVVEANNAISVAQSNFPVTGWMGDWPLPQRLRPNPDIYANMSRDTPLPLRASEPPHANSDKGTKR